MHLTRRFGALAALTLIGTASLASVTGSAHADDLGDCTTRLVTAESATVGAFAPRPVLGGPVIGVAPGNPSRLAGDTSLNAQYFVDCVV
jgi:hypothetical protein